MDRQDTLGDGHDVILFDGLCVLCSGFARFVAARDAGDRYRFVTAQSARGRALYEAHGLDPDEMSTNVVVRQGRAHTKMAAFAAVMTGLGWPWRAASAVRLVPGAISDPVYDLIASNRYRLGRRTCPLPSAEVRHRLLD